MSTRGSVLVWHDEDGWGVVESAATPGGCWVLWSDLAVEGRWTPEPGEPVELEWEAAEQDGYHFRALRVWPVGQEPFDRPVDTGGSGAYRSASTLTFDDGSPTLVLPGGPLPPEPASPPEPAH